MPRKHAWTDVDWECAVTLLLEGCSFNYVDKQLGRYIGATYNKLYANANSSGDWSTIEAVRRAQRSREHGEQVARRLKQREKDIAALARKRSHAKKHLTVSPGGGRAVDYTNPIEKRMDRNVLAEREHAYSGNQTLGQIYLGEPPRGRSALERMRVRG